MLQEVTALAVRAMLALPSAAPKDDGPNTDAFAEWLRNLVGPLFLAVVSIVAIFFLFTREITRFVQFIVLTVVIAIIFYWPGILTSVAGAAARALGVDGS